MNPGGKLMKVNMMNFRLKNKPSNKNKYLEEKKNQLNKLNLREFKLKKMKMKKKKW